MPPPPPPRGRGFLLLQRGPPPPPPPAPPPPPPPPLRPPRSLPPLLPCVDRAATVAQTMIGMTWMRSEMQRDRIGESVNKSSTSCSHHQTRLEARGSGLLPSLARKTSYPSTLQTRKSTAAGDGLTSVLDTSSPPYERPEVFDTQSGAPSVLRMES